jgi:DNA-binding response OmpR family regulator
MMSISRTVVSASGEAAPGGRATVPADGPLVLLIEDDVCVADVVAHMLTRQGNRVVRAGDGAQAAQHFATHEREVAVVILDCGLPDVDGVSLCRVFRKLAPNLPIVLTSGWDSASAQAMAGVGPTVFLQKPFFPAEMVRIVGSFLKVKT